MKKEKHLSNYRKVPSLHNTKCLHAGIIAAGLLIISFCGEALALDSSNGNVPVANGGRIVFKVNQDALIGGAADFSALNHPIGPADRIIVRNGHFFTVGADLEPNTIDDKQIRFFGINLAFGANFPEQGDAVRIARRFRQLGINAVRFHHMDSRPDKNTDPSSAQSILTDGPFPTINMVSAIRLKYFIEALASEGIYSFLELHVGYQFRPSVDDVPDFPGENKMPKASKPLHIFYPRMITLQEEYLKKIIAVLGVRDNPALASVEISNESSLVYSWTTHSIEKSVMGFYRNALNVAMLDVSNGSVSLDSYVSREAQLAALTELDRQFFARMRAAVHSVTDDKVPVSGTQVEFGSLMVLDSNKDMDVLDSHIYVDHYRYGDDKAKNEDWQIDDVGVFDRYLPRVVARAFFREPNKPFLITEYNQPWPNRYSPEILPFLATFASFQDWDGLFFFAYEHQRDWDRQIPKGFNLNGEMGKLVAFGQAAWIFRAGAINAGSISGTIRYDDSIRKQSVLKGNSAWRFDEFLAKALNVDSLLALKNKIEVFADSKVVLAGVFPKASKHIQSDTGEIYYDTEKRQYRAASPTVTVLAGFLPPTSQWSSDPLYIVNLLNEEQHVAVVLSSRDGLPLAHTKSALLTMPTNTWDTDPGDGLPRELVRHSGLFASKTFKSNTSMQISGSLGGGVEPVGVMVPNIRIGLNCGSRQCRVYALDGSGKRLHELMPGNNMVRENSGYLWMDTQTLGSYYSPWYEIVFADKH